MDVAPSRSSRGRLSRSETKWNDQRKNLVTSDDRALTQGRKVADRQTVWPDYVQLLRNRHHLTTGWLLLRASSERRIGLDVRQRAGLIPGLTKMEIAEATTWWMEGL